MSQTGDLYSRQGSAPAVSIIVPVYNGEKYLEAALRSVMSQTWPDWELIVVDDGSTDGTPQVAERLQPEARLRYVRQANQGVGASRNQGLRLARGEVVAFLDADDVWTGGYLRRMWTALAAAPGAGAVFCSWQYMDEAGQLLPQAIRLTESEATALPSLLTWRNPLIPSGAMVRRQSIEAAGGFDPDLHGSEDWDLWLRLARPGAFVIVPEVLAWYRIHDSNATEQIERIERECLKLHRKHAHSVSADMADWPEPQRRGAAYVHLTSALAYLRQCEDEAAWEKLRRAMGAWPALLEQEAVSYELACARQPRGWLGTPQGLDLGECERVMGQALEALALTPAQLRAARARGSLALMKLARQVGQRRRAAGYALRAAWQAEAGHKARAAGWVVRALIPAGMGTAVRRRFTPARPKG